MLAKAKAALAYKPAELAASKLNPAPPPEKVLISILEFNGGAVLNVITLPVNE